MKGIREWAKDLKHNEKVAKKFEGVKSVEDILNVAHNEGYEFTERELLDFDLNSVAGGTDEAPKEGAEAGFGGVGTGAGAISVGPITTGDISAAIKAVVTEANIAVNATGANATAQNVGTISQNINV